MSCIENLKNMRTAKFGGTTKEALMIKAAMQDMLEYVMSLSEDIYGDKKDLDEWVDAFSPAEKQIDNMIIESINNSFNEGIGNAV